MKVQKTKREKNPGYPSRRQFQEYRHLAGVAVIGLSTIIAGCRTAGKPVEPSSRLAGEPPVEPVVLTTTTMGIPPMEPSAKLQGDSPFGLGETVLYKVQKGDTLWRIAKQQLGSGNRWAEITAINANLTEKTLKAGKTILIPKTIGVTTTTVPGNNESPDIRTKGKMPSPR
jgi:nucleoid-associated protein YgaU